MKKYNFITIGGATEDITFFTREGQLIDNGKDILRQNLLAFEYGTKIKIDRSISTFGGGAANAAVCFSRLGFSASALIAVGDDSRGQNIIANLKNEKVDTSLVEKFKDEQSGFSFILTGTDNEHIVFSSRGANSRLSIKDSQLKILNNAKRLYVTSLSGKWQDALKKIFSVKGAKITWNPGHIQLNSGVGVLGKYLKKTEVLIINKDEAIELVVSSKAYRDKPNEYLNNVENLIKIIKTWGPSIVIVTNGKYGAHAYDGKKVYYQGILKEKKRINTTGVGDAFGSTFTAGLEIFKGDIKKAMQLAVRNSASIVAHFGAQTGLLKKKDVKI